ncbi:hypothetical protein WICPIJ_004282 [Wickerhamomyces pijperi]|uniref:Peptidyl-prolyl cis-trans isomerase n=1 Tax=Wickerhamomyces pijperi TaxID=599730 RepID=A0A9P8TMX7_WICPI|nr:hypothetical protein WICPIJ_004282 [Wickerhamomyces pijperi]
MKLSHPFTGISALLLSTVTLFSVFSITLKQVSANPIHTDHESQIPQTHFVYFDLAHGTTPLGTIKIALFGSVVPKTVKNFYTIATTPYDPSTPDTPTYENSIFHRIIKDFMIQGGDYEKGTGTGGKSIYDGTSFADENFEIRHDVLGRVSMANAGPDTNGSQFFIITAITNWLDGKHVVFGQVVEGLDLILEKVQMVDVAERTNKPLEDVRIVKSWGEINQDVTVQEIKDFEEIMEDEKSQDKMGFDYDGRKHEMFVFGGLVILIGVYLAVKIFKGAKGSGRYASLRE